VHFGTNTAQSGRAHSLLTAALPIRLQRTDFSSQSTIFQRRLTGCPRVAIPGFADHGFNQQLAENLADPGGKTTP
jgi:hypothetical protein